MNEDSFHSEEKISYSETMQVDGGEILSKQLEKRDHEEQNIVDLKIKQEIGDNERIIENKNTGEEIKNRNLEQEAGDNQQTMENKNTGEEIVMNRNLEQEIGDNELALENRNTGEEIVENKNSLEEREDSRRCSGTNGFINDENEELEDGEIANEDDQEKKSPVITQQKKTISFKTHRGLEELEDSSDSSDSSSVDSEKNSSDSDSDAEQLAVSSNKQLPVKKPIKTHGEISLEDLPPIDALQITVGDDVNLVEIGEVLHCFGSLVVVESKPNLPPLDADTILFLEEKQVLGQIFDTIGQVSRPCYTIRFNRESEIVERGIKSGVRVFYAPDSPDWTRYVFLAHVMKVRGSDASWEHDNEPPAQFIDYSDDEAERAAKAKRRGRDNDGNNGSDDDDDEEEEKTTKSPKIIHKSRGNGNAQKNAGRRNKKSFGNNLHHSKMQPPQNSGDFRSSRPLTSWPPKFIGQRTDFKESHGNAWPPVPQLPRFCRPSPPEARFPLPDLSRPPPRGFPTQPPIPPPSFVPAHPIQPPPGSAPQHPGILPCRMAPSSPAFQAVNPMPWRPFQNFPPFSATDPGPSHPPFFSSQVPPPDTRSARWLPPPPSQFPPRHFPFAYPHPH